MTPDSSDGIGVGRGGAFTLNSKNDQAMCQCLVANQTASRGGAAQSVSAS